uniref:Small integral membrane protein 1 n=1 Tax=Mus musculus TaxID=10090 RepID=S4R2T3_MOUSE
MQSQESGVHYSRWDSSSRDEVSMTAMSSSEEASCYRRYSSNRPAAPTDLTSFVQAQPVQVPTAPLSR